MDNRASWEKMKPKVEAIIANLETPPSDDDITAIRDALRVHHALVNTGSFAKWLHKWRLEIMGFGVKEGTLSSAEVEAYHARVTQ